MLNNYRIILLVAAILCSHIAGAQKKVLFDCTKAETAANADWQIDSDVFDLGNSGGIMRAGRGNEADPQQKPTPAWTTVTSSTAETYWQGSGSSWGIDIAKQGYEPQTLPNSGKITFNDATNAQDLSKYQVFIMDEPNILLTTTEKTAVLAFVHAGGGLFIISDHVGSDRNNDGKDSPTVLNDLITNNSTGGNPFGFTYDLTVSTNFGGTFTGVPSSASNDSVIHGPMGSVTSIKLNGATTMILNSTANSNVKGLLYASSLAVGTTNLAVVSTRYGSGRVVGLSDSSPFDDGTGDPNDVLYSSYLSSVSGNHQKLAINAVLWLLGPTVTGTEPEVKKELDIFGGATETGFLVHSTEPGHLLLTDILGHNVWEGNTDEIGVANIPACANGAYFLRYSGKNGNQLKKLMR